MNENIMNVTIGTMVKISDADMEKLATAIIVKCAQLNDSWVDSGEFATFGERLKAYFGVTE